MNSSLILYELLDNGSVVLSGTQSLSGSTDNYLGFSGGGFDTIRIRDNLGGGTSVTDGSVQALAIDNIETQGSSLAAVPELPSIAIWPVLGLIGIGLHGWKRRQC